MLGKEYAIGNMLGNTLGIFAEHVKTHLMGYIENNKIQTLPPPPGIKTGLVGAIWLTSLVAKNFYALPLLFTLFWPRLMGGI